VLEYSVLLELGTAVVDWSRDFIVHIGLMNSNI
jgi:hypothetical protein